MKKRGSKRGRRDGNHRRAVAAFPDLRIRWIDRVTNAIDSYPGAPPGSDLARTCGELYRHLRTYRDGFVHALNLTRGPKR